MLLNNIKQDTPRLNLGKEQELIQNLIYKDKCNNIKKQLISKENRNNIKKQLTSEVSLTSEDFKYIFSFTMVYNSEDPTLYDKYPNLYYNKIKTVYTVNLLYDIDYNSYCITTSYLSRQITLTYIEIKYSNKYCTRSYDEEEIVETTFMDYTPYYDILYLDNNDFILSFLLCIFIQQKRYYPTYDYKYIMEDINDKKCMSSIIQIKNFLKEKFKEDKIIYNILSYL